MTVSDALQQAGIELNAPIQQVANNPNLPQPIANIVTITGNSIQYAMGPTAYFVIAGVGINPNVPQV